MGPLLSFSKGNKVMDCTDCRRELPGIQTHDTFSIIYSACPFCGVEWEYLLAEKELVEFGRVLTDGSEEYFD